MPLLVCATPIGNLDDVTLRVLDALRAADVVLCEDTRHTRILLDRHGIRARSLVSLHRHNEAARVEELLPRLRAGETVALVTDAGTPGIADPGARVIAAAAANDVEIHVLPGPSAVVAAVVASGLASDEGFRFVGWLPRREGEREALWRELATGVVPVAAFESPRRLPVSLASLAAAHPDVRVCVCRELTKRFEETVRGNAQEVASRFAEATRGEIVVVIAPVTARRPEADDAARAAVRELVEAGAPRGVAATVVSRLTGVARNELYQHGL
ncbi:MAG: 16S rRNA (cytidine(1402)-2'-O)-methyltransferase [Actinobacteria bacterium]|nr:16S rRNA (cytidine(1402)-2'-O)-methyltransferase [Actinomycetota bacterium]